ncbi:hypothetical protein HYH03_009501 [Edaphochlamys debaryana]|uniref:Uncharacterized protein n=1 Tax=Edaphochlamys debaryana TaxID=47281 RepID=A0A835Y1C4_9CHLO|nr:hypothetical protein HYH03_009501 [Edaphochlamys debaryana]|eukprot:KAG2492261.1 hypothetical protein HYH03_009501 [Edaphochlamys debaryana]
MSWWRSCFTGAPASRAPAAGPIHDERPAPAPETPSGNDVTAVENPVDRSVESCGEYICRSPTPPAGADPAVGRVSAGVVPQTSQAHSGLPSDRILFCDQSSSFFDGPLEGSPASTLAASQSRVTDAYDAPSHPEVSVVTSDLESFFPELVGINHGLASWQPLPADVANLTAVQLIDTSRGSTTTGTGTGTGAGTGTGSGSGGRTGASGAHGISSRPAPDGGNAQRLTPPGAPISAAAPTSAVNLLLVRVQSPGTGGGRGSSSLLSLHPLQPHQCLDGPSPGFGGGGHSALDAGPAMPAVEGRTDAYPAVCADVREAYLPTHLPRPAAARDIGFAPYFLAAPSYAAAAGHSPMPLPALLLAAAGPPSPAPAASAAAAAAAAAASHGPATAAMPVFITAGADSPGAGGSATTAPPLTRSFSPRALRSPLPSPAQQLRAMTAGFREGASEGDGRRPGSVSCSPPVPHNPAGYSSTASGAAVFSNESPNLTTVTSHSSNTYSWRPFLQLSSLIITSRACCRPEKRGNPS